MSAYQVVGIGNAIVDVISQSNDSFLELMGIQKGIMQLVERDRGELLYGAMENRIQTPGGSVANTIAGLGKLGPFHWFHRPRTCRRSGQFLCRGHSRWRDRLS